MYFSTERLFLNLSATAPALFVRLSCVPQLIMAVVKSLNCFNPLLFIIRLTEVRLIPMLSSTFLGDRWLPGLPCCEQIKFLIRFKFSSVVIVRCLPEPALLTIELSSIDGNSIPTYVGCSLQIL